MLNLTNAGLKAIDELLAFGIKEFAVGGNRSRLETCLVEAPTQHQRDGLEALGWEFEEAVERGSGRWVKNLGYE